MSTHINILNDNVHIPGFEIYVDPTDDPELGEILVVKKKKSRPGLDGMNWGTLGEVTNVPLVTPKEPMLKVKMEEKDKWWSIGRGRKDSKEKVKELEEKEAKEAKSREKSKTRVKYTCLRFISSQSNSPTSQPLPCVRLHPTGNVRAPFLFFPPH
jgi:hypothetical protein